MKTLKFSKKSWHYQMAIAAGYHPGRSRDPVTGEYTEKFGDICSYYTAVVKWFAVMALSMVVLIAVSVVTFEFLFGVVFSLYYWSFMFSGIGTAALVVIMVLGAAMLALFALGVVIGVKDAIKDNIKAKPDSFVSSAYRSWKDKFCSRIEFI